MKTWKLRDVGYDANRHGQLWDVTDETLMDAIRQLDGFGGATFAEPIAPRSSIYAVYQKLRGATDVATKIGCVRNETGD